MPTYNRVVYHEGKHETDVTAECTKIKLSTATLHTCRYVVSTAQDKPNQTSNNNNNNSIYLYSAIYPELKSCSEALITTSACL